MKMSKLALALLLVAACDSPSDTTEQALEQGDGTDCALTQGYWKNHASAWDVTTLTLGNVTYTQDELLGIFHTPVRGNGLVSLAHQLIAAKLNIANGADATGVDIAGADALIGNLVVPPIGEGYLAPSATSHLVGELDAFNNSGDATCAPPGPSCGNGTVEEGEACDDGNTTDGDGCSANCTEETSPCCGDGVIDAGEQCDDGNTTSGDGCSASCQTEKTPCCGDGVLDAGEQCDDGNTTSGDGCSSTCQTEKEPCCGDGVLDSGEQCDDGNTTSGDGCSSTCGLEISTEPLVFRADASTVGSVD